MWDRGLSHRWEAASCVGALAQSLVAVLVNKLPANGAWEAAAAPRPGVLPPRSLVGRGPCREEPRWEEPRREEPRREGAPGSWLGADSDAAVAAGAVKESLSISLFKLSKEKSLQTLNQSFLSKRSTSKWSKIQRANVLPLLSPASNFQATFCPDTSLPCVDDNVWGHEQSIEMDLGSHCTS